MLKLKPDPKPESWWDSGLGKITTAIIIPILVSIIVFQLQLTTMSQYQQKDVANKFLAEIEVLEPNLYFTYDGYMSSKITKQGSVKTDFIYPNTGLYYTNSNDLGKFDHSLTKNLTQFYFRLTTSEASRKKIIEYQIILSPNSTASDYEKNMAKNGLDGEFSTILTEIEAATKQIPELKNELKNVEGKKLFFFW